MKNLRSIILITLCYITIQTGHSQKTDDWLRTDAILDLSHFNTGPYSERDSIMDFLQEEYFPVVDQAYPGTFALHIQGIDGTRKGHHVKFWIFPSIEVRDSYYPKEGERPTQKYRNAKKWTDRHVSRNKFVELFRDWDWGFKTDWRIISSTEPMACLSELRGLEMDMHYLQQDQQMDQEKLEAYLLKNLQQLPGEHNRYFLLYGDRGTRKGTYAILELHSPGPSQQEALQVSGLTLDRDLWSSYRIW